eukprot:3864993-Lingulodinium_polyedra.AAC.1
MPVPSKSDSRAIARGAAVMGCAGMASSGCARWVRSNVISLPSSIITCSDTQFLMASCSMLCVKPRPVMSCIIVSKRT